MIHLPKNLIFDLGNVIIDLDIPRAEGLLAQLANVSFTAPTPEDLQIFLDFETGLIPEALFLNHLIGKSRGKAHARDIIDAWTSMLKSIPLNRLLMLRKLRENFNVYLLSNTNETHIRFVNQYIFENYQIPGLHNLVHQAFYSHNLKCRKPEERIYRLVQELAGIDPGESLFFDDHEANLEGAQAAGFQTFWVDPQAEITELVDEFIAEYSMP